MSDYAEPIEVGAVRFQRTLPGPIERVFAHLVDPALRATWFAGGATEPRVGGKLVLRFDHSSFAPEPVPERFARAMGFEMQSKVTRFDPPRMFGFEWEDGSEVVFELEPKGKQVLLTLTHRKVASRDTLRNVSAGWHSHLDVLACALQGEKPKAFWSRIEPLEQEYAKRLG